ncbi:MAG: flagellar hook-length control protein FliK [Spirochaetaceae bacterium]|nr:flagellar hook-length control protein FliK [Spirochaetaceae bacterium]
MNPALFNTSGFLTAEASYTAMPFMAAQNTSMSYLTAPSTPASYSAAENSSSPKFSDYLAAAGENVNEPDEAPAPVESAGAKDENKEEAPAGTVENNGGYLAMPQMELKTTVAGENTELDGEVSAELTEVEVSEGIDVRTEVQAELGSPGNPPPEPAFPVEAEVDDKNIRQDLNVERNIKTGNADTGDKTGKTNMKGNENNAADSGRIFNASEGIYFDEKTTDKTEQLAEEKNADGADKKDSSVKTNAGAAEAIFDNVDRRIAAVSTDATAFGKKQDGGEKKSAPERGKRRTEYVEINAAPSSAGGSPQSAETAETRRVSASGAVETEITVTLRGEPQNAGEQTFNNGGAKQAASFENFLARELQQNLNGDIVRQAQVMLRENGEGTIRLSLKPESLGKVKIHLEMTENKITGKIVVESGEALRAFEREMRSLEQSFRNEGFGGANLSLELAEHEQQQGWEWQAGDEKFSAKTASSRYDEAVDKVINFDAAAYSSKQVNVLI